MLHVVFLEIIDRKGYDLKHPIIASLLPEEYIVRRDINSQKRTRERQYKYYLDSQVFFDIRDIYTAHKNFLFLFFKRFKNMKQ